MVISSIPHDLSLGFPVLSVQLVTHIPYKNKYTTTREVRKKNVLIDFVLFSEGQVKEMEAKKQEKKFHSINHIAMMILNSIQYFFSSQASYLAIFFIPIIIIIISKTAPFHSLYHHKVHPQLNRILLFFTSSFLTSYPFILVI